MSGSLRWHSLFVCLRLMILMIPWSTWGKCWIRGKDMENVRTIVALSAPKLTAASTSRRHASVKTWVLDPIEGSRVGHETAARLSTCFSISCASLLRHVVFFHIAWKRRLVVVSKIFSTTSAAYSSCKYLIWAYVQQNSHRDWCGHLYNGHTRW